MEDAHQSFTNLQVAKRHSGSEREKEREKGEGANEKELEEVAEELTESLEKGLVEKAVKDMVVCSFFGVYDGHGGKFLYFPFSQA